MTENQLIVLEMLMKNSNQGLDEMIVGGMTYMTDKEIRAIESSSQEELFKVLRVFSKWGLAEE